MILLKPFTKAMMLGGLTFLLLPAPSPVPALVQRAEAQAFPARLRRPPAVPGEENYAPPGAPTPTAAAPAPPNAAPAAQNVPPPSQPAAPLPPSMLQQPALPATIQFSAQSLSIHADNSSLREILHQLAQKTGMDVQGLGNDERVFGSFGPGDPLEVVGDLLNGTSYNLLMVGVLANGAPRQLVLSPVSHVAASVAPSSPPPPADADNDDTPPDNPDNNDTPPSPRTRPLQNAPRPGEPPSPQGIPAVKSPQELFQQLQQMHEQQQQQPGQPPPQQPDQQQQPQQQPPPQQQ